LLTAFAVEESDESASDELNFSTGEGSGEGADPRDLSAEQLKDYLEKMRPEDFGKFNL
jgi:hypothetical protein